MEKFQEMIVNIMTSNQNRFRRKIFFSMASVVVFVTTYMLILPAITKSTDTYCGHTEHIHSESCYEGEQELICQETEGEGHTHSKSCYSMEEILTCELGESKGHTHSDSCYEWEDRLTCEDDSEDHVHGDDCYEKVKVLVCDKEESKGHTHSSKCYKTEKKLICDQKEQKGHKHKKSCYKDADQKLTCKEKEHEHTLSCYSNPNADLEQAKTWEKSVKKVELTTDWSKDVLLIADSQLGYTESSRNYEVVDGTKKKGYTRYGAWYGVPYGDWCAMFVSFCINYAEIPTSAAEAKETDGVYVPIDAGCQNWIEKLNSKETPYYYAVNDDNKYKLVNDSKDFEPEAGNIIFFNWDSDPDSDHVGFVYEVIRNDDGEIEYLKTIEGNSSNTVKYNTYKADDESIMGYAVLPKNPNEEAEEEESEAALETETDTESQTADESASQEETSVNESETAETTVNESETTETGSEDKGNKAMVEYDDYIVTVTYDEGIEIPAGAVLEADLVTDQATEDRISEYLDTEYSVTDQNVYNLRFVVEGETYTIDEPVDVDIAMKSQEEDTDPEQTMVLQLSEEITTLQTEVTEADGLIHYQYSQESLEETAILTGLSMIHSLSYEADDYSVIVSYPDQANFPDNVELSVKEVLGDELEELCNEISNMEEINDIQYARLFDIAFLAEGKEIEPEVPVQVQIIRKDLVDLVEDKEPGIVHFGEEETEVLDVELTTEEDGAANFAFEGTSFSIYASYVSDPLPETANSTHPATIATVDTKALGITINMFDYWGSVKDHLGVSDNNMDTIDKNWTNGSSDYVFDGINARHTQGTTLLQRLQSYLYFSTSGTTFQGDNERLKQLTTSINAFTGANDGFSGKARQGIVDSTLTNGYPTLATSGSNHESLSYLFAPNNGQDFKYDYLDLNHLFKDIGNGYISYSSDNNYARLNTDSGNFKVYSETFNNSDGSKIGFFPFNDYNSTKTHVKNPEDETNYYNHHFGLTLTADFVIPTGKQIDDEDIIFYFSGDDDFWMFIDDVLVLDIGGIHEPCDGEVNFTTGDVIIGKILNTGVVSANPGAATTIGANSTLAEIFAAAGKTWDTSADTVHTMKIFYMERGGCYSNLTMTMNIPIYAEVPVAVTKALEGTLKEEAADEDFTFQIMVEKASGTGEYEPYTGTLDVTDGSNNRTITADSETGYFTIKGGETATTTGKFITTKKFYVNEVGIDGTMYEMVNADGVEHTLIDPSDISDDPLADTSTDVQSDITDSAVVFDPEEHMFKVSSNEAELFVMSTSKITNVIREEKTDLTVNKVWYDGNAKHTSDTVKFRIFQKDVNNPDGTETLYTYNGKTEFELDSSNDWQMEFTDLMKKTLGHEYEYSVKEITVKDGYRDTYGKPETDSEGNTSITITNGPEVNISAQKKWYKLVDGKEVEWDGHISNDGVQVQLYRTYYRAAYKDKTHTVTFRFYNDSGGRDVTTSYQVADGGSISFKSEYRQTQYYTASYIGWYYTDPVIDSSDTWTEADGRTITISNITSDMKVYCQVGNRQINNATNAFQVTAQTAPKENPEESGVEPVGSPVTLNADNDWYCEWGKLETPSTDNGYTYTYYVKEISTSNNYEVSYEDPTSISYEINGKSLGLVGVPDSDGIVEVKNILVTYELPKTGGVGTTPYTMGGIMMILSACVLYSFSLRRRRERRGQ